MTAPRSYETKEETPGIALLVAVPVNRAEFNSRVSTSDWLGKFDRPDATLMDRQCYRESEWERHYRPWVVEPLRELLQVARSLGVEVRTSATLATLQEITQTYPIVILIAHWRGSDISNDDFITPVEHQAFVQRAREANTPLGHWLFDRFCEIGIGEGNTGGPARRRRFWPFPLVHEQSLRDILIASLKVELPGELSVSADIVVTEHEATRAARRRDTLDAIFQGLLRPGNRLELFDGLHEKEVVEAALAPNFAGVLDLTTCTSLVLGDFIAARRHLRLRTVQFPTVQEPLWAAKCVKATIELVALAGLPYLDARNLACHELEQALSEVAQSKRLPNLRRLWRRQ